MDILIREAKKEDLPGILSLYSQPELDDGCVLSAKQAESMLQTIQTYPNYFLYVAVQGESWVGTFSLLIMDNLIHGGMPSGIVEAVAVDPMVQGQGIGKQMMQFAMSRCREFGCYKLTLSANLKRHQAHNFYESLGFEKHGFSFVVDLQPTSLSR